MKKIIMFLLLWSIQATANQQCEAVMTIINKGHTAVNIETQGGAQSTKWQPSINQLLPSGSYTITSLSYENGRKIQGIPVINEKINNVLMCNASPTLLASCDLFFNTGCTSPLHSKN